MQLGSYLLDLLLFVIPSLSKNVLSRIFRVKKLNNADEKVTFVKDLSVLIDNQ